MKQEELSLIKDQMNDLFMAHRQMSGIYKNSIIKLLSRAIDDEFIFNEPVEITFRGKIVMISAVKSKRDSYVKIRGSWNCCSGSSCSASNKEIEIELYFLSPDEVIDIADKIIRNL